MMSEATKPNIKRKIADTFGDPLGWLASSVAVAALSFTIIPAVIDDNGIAPDATGTAMEETIMAQHQADFVALQEMKAQITLLEAQDVLVGNSAESIALKKEFGKQAVETYTDLYLEGATQQDGAAISEQNFEQLRRTFAENIIDPASIGFQKNITAGMLDETLANTALDATTDAGRFSVAQNIDSQLSAIDDQEMGSYDIAGITAGGIAFLLLALSMAAGVGWCNEPKRVPLRKPKKSTPYGKH